MKNDSYILQGQRIKKSEKTVLSTIYPSGC